MLELELELEPELEPELDSEPELEEDDDDSNDFRMDDRADSTEDSEDRLPLPELELEPEPELELELSDRRDRTDESRELIDWALELSLDFERELSEDELSALRLLLPLLLQLEAEPDSLRLLEPDSLRLLEPDSLRLLEEPLRDEDSRDDSAYEMKTEHEQHVSSRHER